MMALRLIRTWRHPQGRRGSVMGVTRVGIRDAYIGTWRGEYENRLPAKDSDSSGGGGGSV